MVLLTAIDFQEVPPHVELYVDCTWNKFYFSVGLYERVGREKFTGDLKFAMLINMVSGTNR
mgnify:CR=1 FL=1